MPTITPFLWFNDNAEEAANFYVSIFKNSKVMDISRYGEGSPYPAGTAMIVNFQLDGRDYMALNGGPEFKFTEAFSLFVSVKTQEEVDDLWERLSEGGEKGPCGWLKDKFGLSWQIIPTKLGELLGGPDPVKAQRAMQAMLQMGKIDSVALQRAYDQD
jgi:predicted 3-demethylubiquinone-9 3-methyltransferase (glyoxalase superfamily)